MMKEIQVGTFMDSLRGHIRCVYHLAFRQLMYCDHQQNEPAAFMAFLQLQYCDWVISDKGFNVVHLTRTIGPRYWLIHYCVFMHEVNNCYCVYMQLYNCFQTSESEFHCFLL